MFKTIPFNHTILLNILVFILVGINPNGVAQTIPEKCYDNQADYSFMWWLETIKKENKIFGVKTNNYAFSFDYKNLTIPSLRINNSTQTEEQVLRETNDKSFSAGSLSQISFGMFSNTRNYYVQAYSQNIDDCQLIETGKYFNRRFINNLADLNGCNRQKSGLEISSWPDRFAFILRATPNYDLENRGLFIDFTFPAEYSVVLEQGGIMALKNPDDGSGFVILKSTNAESFSIIGTKVSIKTALITEWPEGHEINCGMIVYPVSENIEVALEKFTGQELQPVTVRAEQIAPVNNNLAVNYNRDLGWHLVTLRSDGNTADYSETSNDRMERVKLSFENFSAIDKVVRLNLAKGRLTENAGAVFGITGLSAIFRDKTGNPVGIPIQLSKNWHTSESQKEQYFRGPWYHGLCMLTIPANTSVELEYTSVNALWGNVPAASHAQLCLVGWGANQQWDQSAIGSWGESITYEPDLDQAGAPVLDFRPLMIANTAGQNWGWTGNMGGADFFNYTKTSGVRSWHSRMRTHYKKYGPNLTEVTYGGTMDDNSMDFEYTASIGRSDDMVRGIYKIKLNVLENTSFSDFVFFQMAAPTYHYTKSGKLAWGNENGLKKEWAATIGGDSRYITEKQIATGNVPWFSFTNSEFTSTQDQFRPANRGFVIRNWKARINGQNNIPPSFAEYNATGGHGGSSSLINITPPEDCGSFQIGDYIEAVIEMFQIPLAAGDYYGPNQNFKNALKNNANTWEMVRREALGNHLEVTLPSGGELINNYPILIKAGNETVIFNVSGGRGYVPLTITNVKNYQNPALYRKDGDYWVRVDQSYHGNDYWQTEYSASNGTWDITYNINLDSPNDERQTVQYKFEADNVLSGGVYIDKKAPELKVYPNPSDKGYFNLEFITSNRPEIKEIRLYDLQGRIVEYINPTNKSIIRVNTQLNPGMYMITLFGKEFVKTHKVIINNP